MIKINLLSEKWRIIPEFPRYAVSNQGRLMRIDTGKFIKPFLSKNGYLHIILCQTGKRFHKTVHRLIALTFLGPCPSGKEVNHKNGIKTNNKSKNLEYLTKAENENHASQMGLKVRGTRFWSSKLTEKDVLEIIQLRQEGWSYYKIGEQYKVSRSSIRRIFIGQTWNWFTKINN
ncbi:MAG: hypothetical protein E3J56_13180 [Candidatus Aminicenantes bacterium]|nr:MAG: hypothetical protein E3J56_13180 [Candidatus Aminicenantes bacterium]